MVLPIKMSRSDKKIINDSVPHTAKGYAEVLPKMANFPQIRELYKRYPKEVVDYELNRFNTWLKNEVYGAQEDEWHEMGYGNLATTDQGEWDKNRKVELLNRPVSHNKPSMLSVRPPKSNKKQCRFKEDPESVRYFVEYSPVVPQKRFLEERTRLKDEDGSYTHSTKPPKFIEVTSKSRIPTYLEAKSPRQYKRILIQPKKSKIPTLIESRSPRRYKTLMLPTTPKVRKTKPREVGKSPMDFRTPPRPTRKMPGYGGNRNPTKNVSSHDEDKDINYFNKYTKYGVSDSDDSDSTESVKYRYVSSTDSEKSLELRLQSRY